MARDRRAAVHQRESLPELRADAPRQKGIVGAAQHQLVGPGLCQWRQHLAQRGVAAVVKVRRALGDMAQRRCVELRFGVGLGAAVDIVTAVVGEPLASMAAGAACFARAEDALAERDHLAR